MQLGKTVKIENVVDTEETQARFVEPAASELVAPTLAEAVAQ